MTSTSTSPSPLQTVFILVSGLLAVVPAAQAAAQTYHVSPDGSDEAAGTAEQPLRTIQQAFEAARAADEDPGPLTILLRGGRHELPATIRLDGSHSGEEGQPTVIRAEEGETPVLSGGTQIGGWTLHDKTRGIYKAAAPPFAFRQLYVNGRRAIRARTPNRENNRTMGPMYCLRAWILHEDQAFIRVRKEDLAGFDLERDLDGAEIVIFRHWDQHRLRLDGAAEADDDAVHLSLREPEGSSSLKAPWPQQGNDQTYYLENSSAFLDAPGEWYLDVRAGQVYYKPYPDEDMATAAVYAPRLEQLLVASDVHHLRIAGLTFEHSTWLEPDEQGYVGLQAMNYYDRGERRATAIAPAAVVFSGCSHIAFERNILQHTGASGLAFADGSHHNLIRGNVIRDIAGNALHMNLENHRVIATHDDEISHNYVYGYGRDYHGGVGILLSYVFNTTVEHNRVFHGPYTGISLGWGWTLNETSLRNNQIHFNDVHDVVEAMDDGGCLYTLSRQDGTTIFENHFHDLTRSPWAGHHPHYSLYFDQGSKNMTAENNVLHHESRDYFDGTVYLQTFANGTEHITIINEDARDPRIIANAGPKPPHAPRWEAVDDNPPWIRHVWCAEYDRLVVRFSEPVEESSAAQPDHYTLDGGASVESARILGPEYVELRVSRLDPDTPYALRVRDVRDTAEAGNRIAHGTSVRFTVGNVSLTDARFGLPGHASARGQAADSGATDARLGLPGRVTAPDQVTDSDYGSPASAFDGNKGTHWLHEARGGESWLQYEFTGGTRCRVDRYTIHAPPAPPSHNLYDPAVLPAAVTLQGSDDGSHWTDIDHQPEVLWPSETASRTFAIAEPAPYSHYRLVIHRTGDPARNRVLIANLDLFGVVERGDD